MVVPLDLSGRRLDLANVFRDWKTPNEGARDLGTVTGSIFGLITRMHAERILEADCDPDPPTRGTQYRLTHEGRVALEEALREARGGEELGSLVDDQRLLIVRGGRMTDIQEVLAEPVLSASIAWGSWLGASWLLAMAENASPHAWRKLTSVLEAAGYECERGRIDELQSGRQLREQSGSNLETASR